MEVLGQEKVESMQESIKVMNSFGILPDAVVCRTPKSITLDENLKKRTSDKGSSWFEYGRSQALAHLNQEKLLLSTVVTKQVEVYELDSDTIPYSGIYVTVKDKTNYTLQDALKILRSSKFLKYVNEIGINVSGKSKRITCKDINNYEFSEECLWKP